MLTMFCSDSLRKLKWWWSILIGRVAKSMPPFSSPLFSRSYRIIPLFLCNILQSEIDRISIKFLKRQCENGQLCDGLLFFYLLSSSLSFSLSFVSLFRSSIFLLDKWKRGFTTVFHIQWTRILNKVYHSAMLLNRQRGISLE